MSNQETSDFWNAASSPGSSFYDAGSDLNPAFYQAAAELYRGSFELAPIGILHLQNNGMISNLNRAASHILGYQSESIRAVYFQDLIHSDERDQAQELQKLLLAGEINHYALECRLLQQDGHYLWLQLIVAVQSLGTQGPSHSIVTLEDISARKAADLRNQHANEELQSKLSQLEAIMLHLPQGVLVYNAAGDLQRANPAAERMDAYRTVRYQPSERASSVEMRQVNGQSVVPDEWPLAKALRGEVVNNLEYEVIFRPDAPSSWYCFNAAQMAGNEDEILLLIFTVHDISSHKQIELALRESELSYKHLADSMPHIVWVVNADGSPFFFNKRWYEFVGETIANDCYAEYWKFIVHPEDLALINPAFAHCLQTGLPLEMEVRLKSRQATQYEWYLVRSVPAFDEKGAITRWYGSSTNINHQKMVEENLRRADKAKDQFFAVLSHELRSPLNVIIGYTDLLKRRGPSQVNFNEAIDAIERNAHSQAQLVGDLLEVSKIITGKMPFEPQIFDPRRLVDTAIEGVRFAAAAKTVELRVDLDLKTEKLPGDPNRIRQILWNLLSNGIKFTPQGGRVSLQTHVVGSWYEIRVSDTGIGLSPEALEHVFDRFWQEDLHASQKQFGLGLGLSIVRHLTELHGGRAWAESPGPGLGAVFVVQLPLASSTADLTLKLEAEPRPNSGDKVLKGRRILAVDDQEDSTLLIKRILNDVGAQVECAHSGVDALQLAMTRHYDLIISDISMPEMDGIDLLREIRQWECAEQKSPIPAIALATYAGELSQLGMTAVGYQRHLTKPISVRRLLQEVHEILQNT